MTLVMLDTDICSYLMRRAPAVLLRRLQDHAESGGTLCVSAITWAELRLGAERSGSPARYHALIDGLSERLDFVADWTRLEADRFARLQGALLASGSPIGVNDAMIAAHALTLEAALATNNARHFSKLPDLRLEIWAQE